MKLNISYLSYDNSDQKLYNRSVEILDNILGSGKYLLDESESNILFIASGGSEQIALNIIENQNNFILLCHRESNSFAAAMEIAAYIRDKNKRVEIIDVLSEQAQKDIIELNQSIKVLDSLNNQTAALIGDISEWLIISDIETELIKDKFGISLIRIPWNKLERYKIKEPSDALLNSFRVNERVNLKETAKVYSLLDETIRANNLSAISVECFSMVVSDKVTACLPLSVLNSKNVVAACEGDICSMLGKMIIRAVTNQIPWQANIAEIKSDKILFAHCTAPLNMLKSYEITTHFETNCGTAIRGVIENQRVGVFRLNNKLDQYMLIEGDITGNPNHDYACRTQIEFTTEANQIELLKDKALGNHQLIFPAFFIPAINRLMKYLEIKKVI